MNPFEATTPGQSRRMLDCGADPGTADMAWATYNSRCVTVADGRARAFGWQDPVPAWSLAAMLRLLPDVVMVQGRSVPFALGRAGDGAWTISYPGIVLFRCDSPIEACVQALEWLAANGRHIKDTKR